jgi:hypothetical protein
MKERQRTLYSSFDVEPPRLQKERKTREQLAEKHSNRSWEKELEGAEIYCQRQEKMKGTRRQPMFLMERRISLLLLLLLSSLVTGFLSSLVLLLLSLW